MMAAKFGRRKQKESCGDKETRNVTLKGTDEESRPWIN